MSPIPKNSIKLLYKPFAAGRDDDHWSRVVDVQPSALPAYPGKSAGGSGRFTFVAVDIRHPKLSDVVAGYNLDVVFHLAAHIDVRRSVDDPEYDARNNVLGTINVLEASRRAGVPRIIYAASGSSRYGAPTALPATEGTPVDPLSPCAAAKVACEFYMRAYASMYELASAHLSGTGQHLYGPRQDPYVGQPAWSPSSAVR